MLRPWKLEDAEVLVSGWSDPEIVRWNHVPERADTESARAWIEGSQRRLERAEAVDLCLMRLSGDPAGDPKVVGEAGLWGIDRDRGAAMVGYWLLPDQRGQGLACGAVQMLTDWALTELPLVMIVARCARGNTPSQRTAAAAGFIYSRDDAEHQLWVKRTACRTPGNRTTQAGDAEDRASGWDS